MVKDLSAKAGDVRDVGSILGLGRVPGVGNGNPLQYSCLKNSVDRGAGGLQSMGLQGVRHITHTHDAWFMVGAQIMLVSFTLSSDSM